MVRQAASMRAVSRGRPLRPGQAPDGQLATTRVPFLVGLTLTGTAGQPLVMASVAPAARATASMRPPPAPGSSGRSPYTRKRPAEQARGRAFMACAGTPARLTRSIAATPRTARRPTVQRSADVCLIGPSPGEALLRGMLLDFLYAQPPVRDHGTTRHRPL